MKAGPRGSSVPGPRIHCLYQLNIQRVDEKKNQRNTLTNAALSHFRSKELLELHLGDHIDGDAKINCGNSCTHIKTCFVFLTILLRVEKHWVKVKTSAIAYSLSVSAHFQICYHTLFTDNANL